MPDGMVTVNEYYKQNPGHILGRLNFGTASTYGRPSMIVDRPYDIETRITQLSTRVPENTYARRTTVKKTIQYVTNNTKGHTLVFYSPYRTP